MKCVHHDGVEGYEENRAPIDPRLAELEVHQGGDMRHKCPYCAYELGVRDGTLRAQVDAAVDAGDLEITPGMFDT